MAGGAKSRLSGTSARELFCLVFNQSCNYYRRKTLRIPPAKSVEQILKPPIVVQNEASSICSQQRRGFQGKARKHVQFTKRTRCLL